MNPFFNSILATFIISLVSLVGILTILFKEKLLNNILFFLIAFSAGSLMGGAFLHLIPESLKYGNNIIFIIVLIGFSLFFILERFLHWHHCHQEGGDCDVHTLSQMNLIGDGFHNFLDGLVVAGAFSISTPLGISTTLAIIAHEIPQEISDFGVLLYGGFSKRKALFYNFLTACLSIIGAVTGYFLLGYIDNFSMILLSFTAGGFIYIAASDLIPELHKEADVKKSFSSFLFFIIGISFMILLKFLLD